MRSLCWLLWGFSAALMADFNQALFDYRNDDYGSARRQFAALTESGSVAAMHHLGLIYLHGHGVEADPLEAYGWLALARDYGYLDSGAPLQQLAQGMGIRQRYFAEQYHLQLQHRFGSAAMNARLLPRWQPQRRKPQPLAPISVEYPTAAWNQRIEGWVKLAYSIDNEGIPRQIAVIDAFPQGVFEQAAIQALRNSRYPPVHLPLVGRQLRLSFQLEGAQASQQSLPELRRKAANGDPRAAYLYATLLADHRLLADDELRLEMMPLLLQAARGGVVGAQMELYQRLLIGDWVVQDEAKALRWLQLAADSGEAWPQFVYAQELSLRDRHDPLLQQHFLTLAHDRFAPAKIELARQLIDAGQSHWPQAQRLLKEVPLSERDESWQLQHARWLFADGDNKEALKLLTRLQQQAKQARWPVESLLQLQQQWAQSSTP